MVGEPTVSTYNSYASRIVSEHGLRSGFEPSTRLLTEAVTWQIADAVVRSYDGDMSHVDKAPPTVTGAVLDLAGQLAEHLRSPDELAEWTARFVARVEALPPAPKQRFVGLSSAGVAKVLSVQRAREQLLPLVTRYVERKRAVEAMDFGDQMSRAAVVARDHPEVGYLERLRYRVVLLDEYQDTSHAQLTLLRSLFGGGHPVTAVGDPCQSIYGWRGASAGNLVRFPGHFPRRGRRASPVRELTVSWRNDESILELANVVSAPLRAPGEAVSVPELQPGPGGKGAGTIRCALHLTSDDEAGWLAARVAEAWAVPADKPPADKPPADKPPADKPPTVAVLARKRSQFDQLATALRAAGLPVEVVGLGGLLDTPEVRDVVATLRVLSDPTAGDALIRLLSGARWRLGPRDLAALGTRAAAIAHQRREGVEDQAPDEVDERSIVEALDDLGPPNGFSPAGYARLCALRDELRALRGRAAQPLPDLVADVERTLSLDVEVATRRSADQALARGHLDAFADVAAEYAETAETATLSAFLAYLKAAEDRERGLNPGQVEVQTGAVQILTVHAAKGLEWDVVAVPGLTAGVFPVKGGTSDTWAGSMGALPFELRGDVDDLPILDLRTATDQVEVERARKDFEEACEERGLAEERRLAYVGVTRARHLLLCSGYWWDQATKPRGPSVFLDEVRAHCEAGGGTVDVWTDPPEPGTNPLAAEVRRADWPLDPLGDRRLVLTDAARFVAEARHRRLTAEEEEAAAGWAEEAELLLAERSRGRRRDVLNVELPSHLSVSQLVALRRDPAELARSIRRPLPFAPAPLARRGTAFHAWLEQRFGSQRLLDLDELPGAADAGAALDSELAALQAAFLDSIWADRVPVQVEVPFATVVDGLVVRGRMDAVFADGGGSWDVIDWKTGAPPDGDAATAAAVQLAAYRLAWADLANVPVSAVRAGFHYVRPNLTVRPADLLDAAGLAALVATLPPA